MSKPNPDADYDEGSPSSPHYALLPAPPGVRPWSSGSCWGLCSPCRAITAAFILLLLIATGFFVWPRKPIVDIQEVTLEDISFNMDDTESVIPSVTLDLSLSLILNITNTNYFGVDYDSVVVDFSYRGDDLGQVELQGGTVPARGVALVASLLDLKGTQLLKHVSDLIVDVANNEVPIETGTVFSGTVQILMFRPHVEVSVYCQMLVDPEEKVLLQQGCSLSF